MSENDPYVAAVTGEEYKAWKGEVVPETPVAEPSAPEPVQVDSRARNADGTFAPVEKTEVPAVKQLFEGYEKLDPTVQREFNRLLGERDDFKTRYNRQLGHTRQLARQTGPQKPASSEMVQARNDTSGMAPGTQRDAVQRQLDKWDAHKAQYPEDAAAIDQRVQALRDDIASGINPLAQELQQLRATVEKLNGGYESMETERAERARHEAHESVGQIAGDNWRHIAGFEDSEGRPIQGKRQWHPEFVAWVQGHDPDIAAHYWESLEKPSAKVVGSVIAEFNRERFGLENAGAQDGHATPDPVSTRRAEALRDTNPGGSRARVSSPATYQPTGDAYADAIRSGYAEWQKA